MAQRLTVAWPLGNMVFMVYPQVSGEEPEVFRSKKDEPPSEFIARVLRKSKHLSGVGVAMYLRDELDKITGEE